MDTQSVYTQQTSLTSANFITKLSDTHPASIQNQFNDFFQYLSRYKLILSEQQQSPHTETNLRLNVKLPKTSLATSTLIYQNLPGQSGCVVVQRRDEVRFASWRSASPC